MNAVSIFSGVAGAIVSVGALSQIIGVSPSILAVVLLVVSLLLLFTSLPWSRT